MLDHLTSYRAHIDVSDATPDTPVTGSGVNGLTLKDVHPIKNCSLTPGDPSPVGRCPQTGDLVYLDRPKDRVHDAAEELLEALKNLLAPGLTAARHIEDARDLLARLGHDVRGAKVEG